MSALLIGSLKSVYFAARRRAAARKIKQMKSSGKDVEELDLEEENNDIYNEIGDFIVINWCWHEGGPYSGWAQYCGF